METSELTPMGSPLRAPSIVTFPSASGTNATLEVVIEMLLDPSNVAEPLTSPDKLIVRAVASLVAVAALPVQEPAVVAVVAVVAVAALPVQEPAVVAVAAFPVVSCVKGPVIFAAVTDPDASFAVVTAPSEIFAVVTESDASAADGICPEARVKVPPETSKVFPAPTFRPTLVPVPPAEKTASISSKFSLSFVPQVPTDAPGSGFVSERFVVVESAI